jgi:hypothetical protein
VKKKNSRINILLVIFLLYASYTLFAIPTNTNKYVESTATDITEPGKPTLNTGYGPQNLKDENMDPLLCTNKFIYVNTSYSKILAAFIHLTERILSFPTPRYW